MEKEIIVAAIGVTGIAMASLLSAIGYYMRARIEVKKSARLVLYYLLEIKHAINTALIDPGRVYRTFIDGALQKIKDHGLPVDRSAIEANLGSVISNHILNIVEAIRVDLDEKLLSPYDEALKELAKINPVLAYSLRGKERLQAAGKVTIQYTSVLESEIFPALDIDLSGVEVKSFSESRRKEALDDLSSALDNDILDLSMSCGFLDYWKTRRALKRSFSWDQEIDLTDIDKMLDEFLVAFSRDLLSATKT